MIQPLTQPHSPAVMADTPPTAVPPRTTSHATNGRTRSQTIVRNQDFRQLLIGMGFPKHRAYVMWEGGGGGCDGTGFHVLVQ